jgi:hypothetical protein
MAALRYLETQRAVQPELAEWYSSMADLYQRKLWHQLTQKLEQFFALTVFQVSLFLPFWFLSFTSAVCFRSIVLHFFSFCLLAPVGSYLLGFDEVLPCPDSGTVFSYRLLYYVSMDLWN